MKVNLEWSLAESLPFDPTISHKLRSIVNHNYTSHIPYNCPSTTDLFSFKDLISRVSSFLTSITNRNSNVLLVTHMPVINAIFHSKGLKHYTLNTYHEPGSLYSLQRL